MSCEVINPTAALPELGVGETHIHTTAGSTGANSHRRPNKENRSTYLTEKV